MAFSRRTHTAELAEDGRSALSAMLKSEMTVFLMVQWCFAAYAFAALLTIVRFEIMESFERGSNHFS
jgi:hypothetical protein